MSAVTIEDLLRDPEPERIRTRVKQKDGTFADAEVVVYLRRPTEVERSICIGAANGARRSLRKKLNDPESDEHKYIVLDTLLDANPDQLRQIWINSKLMERVTEVQERSLEDREYIPEPDEDRAATPAEQDAYDEAVENAETRRQEAVLAAMQSIRRELEEQASTLDESALIEAAKPAHIENVLLKQYLTEYGDQLIARCTFADKKYAKPYFKTVSQVKALREAQPKVVEHLANAHNALLLPMEPTLGN